MENKMKEVAALLGVALEEEFKCSEKSFKYKFTEDGLFWLDQHNRWTKAATIAYFLTGERTIEKLPFYPKEHEHFWYISAGGIATANCLSLNNTGDLYQVASGNCFHTIEEALKNKDRIVQQFEEIRKKCNGVSQ